MSGARPTARPGRCSSGQGHYKGLAFDEKATELAFVSDRDDYTADAPAYKLYPWTAGRGVRDRDGLGRDIRA